ncbi:unnamed protein product [Callosobruchus maculatus]|uniref:Lactate/malate dehydrogenase C-terminal domain-containing protein n=1 Tax=Callosobruchus maculatus TaxID=64391 RepID=A0A653DHK7_CALMS|nr:unnamed protein product [Callosobruchus maculatus]
MPYFVINGEPHCPNYAHALVVAQYLSEKLPNFIYKKVEMNGLEWAEYVHDLNKQNRWYIARGPIVWKEINMWGGKKYLIGGLSEFWEYVYCYYGLESIIPRADLQKLASDNLKFYEEHHQHSAQRQKEKDVRNITIYGPGSFENNFLLSELVDVPNLSKSRGVHFKLFNQHCAHSEKHRELLEDNAEYINELRKFGAHDIATIAKDERDAIEDCDVFIYLENCTKQSDEDEDTWLDRCYKKMLQLADTINRVAKRTLLIILANPGPTCFMATCLVDTCTKIKLSNIVAVSAHKGLPYVRLVSEKTGVPACKMSAPPVWGFVGLHCFVDSRNIVFKADMLRPYERALRAPPGSTLALGTIKSELRKISYMLTTEEDELAREVENRKTTIEMRLERPTMIGNIRALVSLIRLWFAPKRSDEIICLGVCSDHSFQIPAGVVFSQPVMLDEKGKWTPYSKFPLMSDDTRKHIEESIEVSNRVLDKFNIFKAKEEDTLQYKLYDYSVEQGG